MVQKEPLRREWQPTPVFLPEESHGLRSLVGYSSWGCKRIGHDLATKWDLPDGSNVKESACSAGDLGSIPGLGRTPGEGNGNPLQYSCLENSIDRGAWLEKSD